ncbi:MAG TPA: hypothetical protein VIL99_08255, partial [Ignavibacteria bacterium]
MLVQTENTITVYNKEALAIRRNLRAIRSSIIEILRDISDDGDDREVRIVCFAMIQLICIKPKKIFAIL